MRSVANPSTARRRFRLHRSPVRLPASVVTLSAYQFLEVVDISKRGAKLRGSKIPEIGATALFRIDRFEALCQVAWADAEHCGVQFEEPLDDRWLAHFQQAGGQGLLEAEVVEQGTDA